MPNDSDNIYYKKIVELISKKYNSPYFDPHITLVSGFLGSEKELIIKMKDLSKKIDPFKIYLNKISFLNEFFRSIFINVNNDKDFQDVRQKALLYFKCQEEGYFPHMSIAYGNFDSKTKNNILSEIINYKNEFFAEKIFLAYNNEIDLKWKVIKSFKLG